MPKRKKSSVEALWDSQATGTPMGKGRPFCRPEQEPFRVFVSETQARPGRRRWRCRWRYSTHRHYPNGVVQPIDWTSEQLIESFQSVARGMSRFYRRAFVIEIESTSDRQLALPIDGNLSAPPLPEMQGIPYEAPPVTTANRESLDRVRREPGEEG